MNDTDILRQMENEMQRIADEALRGFFRDVSAPSRFWQPRADVHETSQGLVVKVEVAGVRADRLSVSLSSDDRALTVSGERYEDDEERVDRIRCYQLEVSFGPFERQITLPAGARIDRDAITATYRDGILVVTLPKRDEQARESRSIPVSE
jgi:HSP20 family protein